MRKVVIGIVGAALLAASGGTVAAAEQVRIWAPSPVKQAPLKASHRKARAEINVATVILVDRPYRCRVSNEYGLDFRYGGCRTPYWPTRYPF
jgi:hypothetical protein